MSVHLRFPFQLRKKPVGARGCFHPGASTLAPNAVKGVEKKVTGWKIIRVMLRQVWPKDKPSLRIRVVVALSLLIGAKVSLVCLGNVDVNLQ